MTYTESELENGIVLAVVGSRTFEDRERLFYILDKLHDKIGIRRIVSGGADGPDKFAEEWAKSRCVPYTIFPANWKKHGKAAGFIRNRNIVDECGRLLAFWDQVSKGTKNSIDLARKQHKPRKIIRFEPEKESKVRSKNRRNRRAA